MNRREEIARKIAKVQHPQLKVTDNAPVMVNSAKTRSTVFCIDAFGEQVDVGVLESDIDNLASIHPEAMESVLEYLAQ